jgi:TolB protein
MVHLQAGFWQDAIDCFEDLAQDYPYSRTVQRALDEARFKASLEKTTRIRPKRWDIPWRPILVRGFTLLVTVFLLVQGLRLIRGPVRDALAQLQEDQRLANLAMEANDYFEAGDLAEAETRYGELLTATPEHPLAQQRMEQIVEERELDELYQRGVALDEAGYEEEALALYFEIQLRRIGWLDINQRIQRILQHQDQDALFDQAEEAYNAEDWLRARDLYEQIRSQYANYRGDVVEARLYDLYMRLGRDLLEQDPPAPEGIPQALEYFVQALALQPRSVEAAFEEQLTTLYLEAQQRYQAGRWEQAISRLQTLFDLRPDYLRGTVVSMLYEAYLHSGDQYRDVEDCGLAYQRYGQAADLPVADTTTARARRAAVLYCVPPTPTPSNTPTPTPTPTETPIPTPTPIPSSTPIPSVTPTPTPIPLASLRSQIVFFSDDPEQPGLWVMDSTGGNRRYLGPSARYRDQYDLLREQERLSPDGNYRLFVGEAQGRADQIFIHQPKHDVHGDLPHIQVTFNSDLSYDPVWSPDGGRVAYVSQEHGSDDIWVVYSDGTGNRALTRNDWEWDKHPSWSPDSQRIVFWSNRNGVNQIFVMDPEGRNLRRLSDSEWGEYDPMWIK